MLSNFKHYIIVFLTNGVKYTMFVLQMRKLMHIKDMQVVLCHTVGLVAIY